jgi:hypothetical protein
MGLESFPRGRRGFPCYGHGGAISARRRLCSRGGCVPYCSGVFLAGHLGPLFGTQNAAWPNLRSIRPLLILRLTPKP